MTIEVGGVQARVFQYKCALAVKAQAGRNKDWAQIATPIEAVAPYWTKMHGAWKSMTWRIIGSGGSSCEGIRIGPLSRRHIQTQVRSSQKRAKEPFEQRLHAVVRMQRMKYAVRQAAGRRPGSHGTGIAVARMSPEPAGRSSLPVIITKQKLIAGGGIAVNRAAGQPAAQSGNLNICQHRKTDGRLE